MSLVFAESHDVDGERSPVNTPAAVSALDPTPEYTEEDVVSPFGVLPPVPDPASLQKLPLPVAVPQLRVSYDAGFVRAYSPELEKSGITEYQWLRFTDGLNIAMTASPPLRVIDTAGKILSFVPYHWAIIAGTAMQVSAQTSARVISKRLTDRYLLRANSTYFEPRGLKVRLMKTSAVRRFVHAEGPGKDQGKWKQYAEVIGLHLPIASKLITTFGKLAPTIDHTAPGSIASRRMEQFGHVTLPMTLDNLPAPETPDSLLDKTSAFALKLEKRNVKKREAKEHRQRQLLAIVEGRAPRGSLTDPSMSDRLILMKANLADRKAALGRSLSRHGSSGPSGSALSSVRPEEGNRRHGKLRSQVAKADRLEMLRNEGLIWVVLLNAEDDKLIQGTELVDTDAPEIIDQAQFDEILEEENRQDEADAFELHELQIDNPSSSTDSIVNERK